MHQALFRKYRPQTFSQVCGQEHISTTLKSQVAEQRLSHAYLFTGSRGTGKTTSARILAKAINCLSPDHGNPCNECEICRGIDNGSVMDIVEIDAASNNGVDDIRELREKIEYTPTVCKYRVYIIDEVHMLSSSAFNALLKTLEEPPAHAIFILATTEVHKIPATVLSRCQRYDFNRLSTDSIVSYLKHIAECEQFECSDEAALLIAKLADGGMRDAVQLLDLCAGVNGKIDEQTVIDCTGLVNKSYLYKIADGLESGDAEGLLLEIDRLYASSCDMERLCSELISHYRDLLVAKTAKDYQMLIAAPSEELTRIYEQSQKIKFESILHCISVLSDCLEAMKHGSIKRTAVETALLRMCVPSLDSSTDAILHRLQRLEQGGVRAAVSAPPPEAKAKASAPPAAKQTGNESVSADLAANELQQLSCWQEILQLLSEKSPVIYSVLIDSKAYTQGNLLLIDAPNESFRGVFKSDNNHAAAIRAAAHAVTGKTFRLGPYEHKSVPTGDVAADPLDALINKVGDDIELE